MTVWTCPRCGHTEQQPTPVTDVIHPCGKGQRPTHLTPAPTADPAPAATPMQAELWEAS